MKNLHTWINTGLLALVLIFSLVGGNQSDAIPDTNVGGSTSDNWNVGGNLSVTGTSALTGASTFSGTLGVTGATVLDELTQGGLVLATSSTGTATVFAAADLLTFSTWEVTPNTADLTYTFPASSTLSAIVPSAGDSRSWTIINATTTAAIDVIFAAGTGSAIKGAGAAALTIDEDSHGIITLTRKADSDIVITTFFPAAD